LRLYSFIVVGNIIKINLDLRYILFYIIVVVLTSCITLLSQDVPKFINFMGDSGITDLHPNYLTRGFNDYQEFYKIKVTDNQNLFVNTIFGNLIYQREDYFFNDIGFPIKIEFYYNSGSSFRGRFGNSWQFNYNIRFIENNFNKDFLIVREDDRSILFKKNDNQSLKGSYQPRKL